MKIIKCENFEYIIWTDFVKYQSSNTGWLLLETAIKEKFKPKYIIIFYDKIEIQTWLTNNNIKYFKHFNLYVIEDDASLMLIKLTFG